MSTVTDWADGAVCDEVSTPATDTWRALGIDERKVNYGDYRNDLAPALKFRVGRVFVDVGRVTQGVNPDILAREIVEYEQSTWATGGISQNDDIDSLKVVMGLAREYRRELEESARQDEYDALVEGNVITIDKVEQFEKWLSSQGDNGSDKRPVNKRGPNPRSKRPVPDEALAALRQRPWTKHRLACELLWTLGIRAEELLDLRAHNFTDRPGYVWVNRRKGGEQPWLPLIDSLMHPELQAYLDEALMGLAADDPVIDLTYSALYWWIRRNLNAAPHMFRHDIVKRLMDKGCTARQAQTWLGHRSIVTTYGYMEGSVESIVDKLTCQVD